MHKITRSSLVLIFSIVISIVICTQATGLSREKRSKRLSNSDIVIKPPLTEFPEYERLTYRVRWVGVSVGVITASIKGIKKINGRDAYHVEVTAKTNAFCSAIYRIDDKFVSYIDTEHFYTLRHEVHRSEGKYRKDAVTNFDQIKHKAYFENFLDKSKKVFDIPDNTQDTLSACYYFRLLSIAIGKRIEYKVCNNEKNYDLFGVVETKEFIRVPKIGKKAAFHMQPYAKLKGQEVKKGRVSGYFSCDSSRIPLLAVVQAPMLTKVTASLERIEHGQVE